MSYDIYLTSYHNQGKTNTSEVAHFTLDRRLGSVDSFVSLLFHLIPEAGCGRSPQALIITGFPKVSDRFKSTKE